MHVLSVRSITVSRLWLVLKDEINVGLRTYKFDQGLVLIDVKRVQVTGLDHWFILGSVLHDGLCSHDQISCHLYNVLACIDNFGDDELKVVEEDEDDLPVPVLHD